MSLKTISLACVLIVSVAAISCKNKEEKPASSVSPAQTQHGIPVMPSGAPHGEMKPKAEKKVVVPASVKGKWNKVKIVFGDKKVDKPTEYSIAIGSEFSFPNTKLKIAVGEFLPDFRMSETEITSASAELNNPAVRVEVFEDGKSIFKGWLYSKFPSIHPFEHEKYGILFKEALK